MAVDGKEHRRAVFFLDKDRARGVASRDVIADYEMRVGGPKSDDFHHDQKRVIRETYDQKRRSEKIGNTLILLALASGVVALISGSLIIGGLALILLIGRALVYLREIHIGLR